MSFPSTTARVAYSGDGSTVEFSVTFPFQANADLAVVLTTSGVDTTQMLTTHYVVGGAGQDSGGTVRFTTAPASGTTVTIFRDVDLNQERSFTYNGAFPTATVTLAVDKAMQAAQQLNEKLKRTFRVSETNAEIAPLTVAQRAGKVTGFDSAGAPALYEPELAVLPNGAAYDVATIAALKAVPVGSIPANKQIAVAGYHLAGDGGGGIFYYDSASAASDNGGTIIAPTAGSGRWIRIYDGAVNPEWFGLVVGDNTKALLNKGALIAMYSVFEHDGGGEAVFPPGSIYLSPSFTGSIMNVPSNTVIRMSRATKIIVTLGGDTERWTVFRMPGRTNITISGGEIIGDRVTDLGSNYGYGIASILGSTGITVRDIIIRDCQLDGFFIENTSGVLMENIAAYNCRRAGISIVSGTQMTFRSCTFADTVGLGASETGANIESEDATDVTDILFSKCRFLRNGTNGLYVHKGFGAGIPRRVQAVDCEFAENELNGVTANSALADFTVRGGIARDNGADSIVVADCDGGSVEGVKCEGGGRGIYVLRTKNFSVKTNTIIGNTDIGIEIINDSAARPVTNVSILENTLENGASSGIVLAGNNCTIDGNSVNKMQLTGILWTGTNNKIRRNTVTEVSLAADNISNAFLGLGSMNIVTGNTARLCTLSQTGTAQAGGGSTITLSANGPELNDVLNGLKIRINSGTGSGQTKTISDYVGSTKVVTVDSAWSTNPDATSIYEVIPSGNQQKNGYVDVSDYSYIHDNDMLLSGKSGTLVNAGTGSDAAGNRS